MPLKIIHNALFPGLEPCSVCRRWTPMWYPPKDVALCEDCAEIISAKDVPAKDEWFDDCLEKID